MLRKRRSLIGSGGPAAPNEPGGEPSEASPAEPAAAAQAAPSAPPAPGAEPAPSPPPEDPFGSADPFGAADPFGDAPAAPFGEAPADPFGADPFGGPPAADPFGEPPADPFGGYDEIRAEVKETAAAAGRGYSDHGQARHDTTDAGWSNSAFAPRDGSLPTGWGTGTPEPAPFRGALGANKPIRSAFGEDEPPTEEAPSATYEDRAPAMGAPMNVPEPPPIPGLFDRFTPAPPAARSGKSFGGAQAPAEGGRPRFEPTPSPARPSYLDADPEPPKAESKPLARAPARPQEEDDDDEEEAAGGGIPLPLIVGGAALAVGMLSTIVVIGVLNFAGGEPSAAPAAAPIVVPVPVARTVVVPPPAVAPAETDAPSMEETTATTAPVDAAPAAAAAAPVKTQPKARAPKPAPKASATTKSPAANGTLKIRSNRRVLVKVNGQPRDYSPLDLPIGAGTYTISAALPGKPESEQTVTVTLQASSIEPVNFTF